MDEILEKKRSIANFQRLVIKVGTSTLTHETGHLNLQRIEMLVRILCDFCNRGKQVVLVSSGAVSAGIARLGIDHRPRTTEEKQALASVGQSQLMKLYERLFSDYGYCVGQILMTRDVMDNLDRRKTAEHTFAELLKLRCIPIVNENDSVSSDELNFGGNDTLSAYVALVCHADLLVNLSDVDGLYDRDPRRFRDASRIPYVERIDEDVFAMAGGAGTLRGTGGMSTKLRAASMVTESGIPMLIANGADPAVLYQLLEGQDVGTYFAARGEKNEQGR